MVEKMTATEAKARELNAARERRLNSMIEEFIEIYAPEDRHEASRFNSYLHAIVREVYADMSAPVERALTAALNVAVPQVNLSTAPAHHTGDT